MNPGQIVAVHMVRQSTSRGLTEPPREPAPRRPRRAAAHVLQAFAHRLDPCVAQQPQVQRIA
jgi:hypothetical protein